MRKCGRAGLWAAVGLVMASCGGEEGAPGPASPPQAPAAPEPPPAAPLPPAQPADAGPWPLDPARGQSLFVERCQHCHGVGAAGGYGPALTNTITCTVCGDFHLLWRRIDEFMPLRNPQACVADCARDIAAWIINGFSTLPSCSAEYYYESVAAQRFTAVIRLQNFRGLDAPDWRLGFTLPEGHAVTGVSTGSVEVRDTQVLLRPPEGQTSLPDGSVQVLRLEGRHDGVAREPRDLRLEAPPCVAVPRPPN